MTAFGRRVAELSQKLSRDTHESAFGARSTRNLLESLTNGRCRFSVSREPEFQSFSYSNLRFGGVSLRHFQWQCNTACETVTHRLGSHVAVFLPLSGEFHAVQGRCAAIARPGHALIANSSEVLRRTWRGHCDLLYLMFSREQLACLLSRNAMQEHRLLVGGDLDVVDFGQLQAFLQLLEILIDDPAIVTRSPYHPDAAESATSLLSLLLAQAIDRNVGTANNGAITPSFVRKMEAYVRRNLANPISADDLAAVAGVSVRSVYSGFQKYRSTTPNAFVRNERLKEAGRLLRAPGGQSKGNITSVASRVGYTTLSQFSRDFRARYGASPRRFSTSGK
jgi:AraC-like DNA-binding protein